MAILPACVRPCVCVFACSLDIRNNHIAHHEMHKLLMYYKQTPGLKQRVDIDLDGNQVVDEVLNAVSHLAGIFFSIVGFELMMRVSESERERDRQTD
jgi:hypothetical protein